MNSKVFIKIEETFNDFKALVPRYLEVYNNEELLDMFLSRNRNPIFDLSNYKMFKSGLQSKGALMESDNKKKTQDHFIQRKKAMKHIFDYLVAIIIDNIIKNESYYIHIFKFYNFPDCFSI